MTHTFHRLLVAMTLLAVTAAAQAQTLITDSVAKVVATKAAEVRVSLHWPVGGKPTLLAGARTYILGLLRDQTATYDYDSNGKAVRTSDGKEYAGDLGDGQAVAAFYARELHKSLVKSVAAVAADVDIDGVEMQPFNNKVIVRKVWDSPKAVTLSVFTCEYTGGAHGIYGKSSVTISAATGKPVTEIIDRSREGNAVLQQLLRRGLTQYFQEGEQPDPSFDLYDWLFLERGDAIPLPATEPGLTADGVTFTYQPYEIAPYSAGAPTFTVPYADMASFLSAGAKALVP